MPSITREEAEHLARLARLDLAPDELEHLAGQLDVILGAVARVAEVAAGDIPPTSHALPLTNVFRDDVVTPSLGSDAALAGAPAAEDGRFRVPRILGEER
ncbi:MAG TPA: Asp-tRNA(Asn)/Glu-tRNA(Gln) amidotransferase subunit GatC [Jiangellales bacterium]|nr:Asp-tRNA(Asn)/Glu-tRNA(Gln) amidotransferase subunit GatC [Jiangellales bacterium]